MNQKMRDWVREHSPKDGVAVSSPIMGIGEAARLTGLSVSCLRKYEAAGLIIYHRKPKGHRRLSGEDLARIELIQHLIKVRGLNLEGIRRLWALFPCWELKSCPPESREDCPVLEGANSPCWVVLSRRNGCEGDLCRTCEIYRLAAACTEDLKQLVLDLLISQK